MTQGRSRLLRDYGWPETEADLAMGVHPAVVAARLGEPEDYVLEAARAQGWLVSWREEGRAP